MTTPRESDPRRIALDVLRAVDERDAYANLELGRLLRERGLEGRDAGFATELAAGTLRMRGAYDAVIDSLVSRPLDAPVRDALRLGCHQLLSMRVPPHAAVGTTVSLVRAVVGHRPVGLVNAVLRKVAARDLDGWMDHLSAGLATRTSHPEWVVGLLAEALGDRRAELPALLEADNRAPGVTLVARPGLATREELGGEPLGASPYAVALPRGDPGAVPAVREGRAAVQDAGSQLVAVLAASAGIEGRDERWLDLCAGPGGKAGLLGALLADRSRRGGADSTPQTVEAAQTSAETVPRRRRPNEDTPHLLANEVQPHRARLVRSALRALPPGLATVIAGDGTRPAWRPGSFDRVLLDAPCTGLGALRRRPEARWRRSPQDLETLVGLQRRLLESALDSTRPGGVVCYATCSPVVAETAGVVRAILAERPGVRLLDAPALVPWVPDADSATLPGALQLWPHRHRTDAMFAALLRVEG